MRQYPAYTHDDVFYFEYEFAMFLLRLIKTDRDTERKRAKLRAQVREAESRRNRRKV